MSEETSYIHDSVSIVKYRALELAVVFHKDHLKFWGKDDQGKREVANETDQVIVQTAQVFEQYLREAALPKEQ